VSRFGSTVMNTALIRLSSPIAFRTCDIWDQKTL
jgi:hypothetical protein